MRLISFWGKGGVGKTTCSASLAVGLSELEGREVLLVTTDLTPTLSDVLGVRLSSDPSRVEGFTNLQAMELNEEVVIGRWKERFGEEVYRVISSFLPVERDIIEYVAKAPGIADQFMLYVLYELWNEGEYDVIVWDTPASSGSVRLLRIEEEFYSHLGDAVRMYLRLRGFLERIRRGSADPLALIEEWKEIARGIFGMLSDEGHSLYLVSTPEKVCYLLTKRLYDELVELGVGVEGILVNKLMRGRECERLKGMIRNQMSALEEFKASFGSVRVIENVDYEPIGREGLLRFYDYLRGLA